jgi:hypothetical protein
VNFQYVPREVRLTLPVLEVAADRPTETLETVRRIEADLARLGGGLSTSLDKLRADVQGHDAAEGARFAELRASLGEVLRALDAAAAARPIDLRVTGELGQGFALSSSAGGAPVDVEIQRIGLLAAPGPGEGPDPLFVDVLDRAEIGGPGEGLLTVRLALSPALKKRQKGVVRFDVATKSGVGTATHVVSLARLLGTGAEVRSREAAPALE